MKSNKFNKFTLPAAGLVLSAALLVGCGGSEDRQVEYMQNAKTFFDEENFDKARIELKNVLQINPKNAEARVLYGRLEEKQKNYRQAFGHFTAAHDADPNNVEALNKLASYYILSKDFEKGLEYAELALAVDPNNAEALGNKASYYWGTDQKSKAIEFAQKALKAQPGHVGGTALLVANKMEDSPEEALTLINQSLADNKDSEEALSLLKVKVLEKMERKDDIVTIYQDLIAKYPDNLSYPYRLINFYLNDKTLDEEQRLEKAETLIRELISKKPDDTKVKLWLIEFYVKAKGPEEAITQLKKFVAKEPNNFELVDGLAKLHFASGNEKEAVNLYRGIIDNDSQSADSVEARNRLIGMHVAKQEEGEVTRLIKEVLEIAPEDPFALLTRARMKMAKKDYTGAIADLRVILENDPSSTPAMLLLATSQDKNGSTDLALDNFTKVVAIDPDNLVGLLSVGRLKVKKGELEGATEALEKALKVNPGNPEATRLLTDIYTRNERWDDALSINAKLIENDRTASIGHYLRGRTFLRKKDYPEAANSLEKSLELDGRIVEALSALVSAYIADDKKPKAMKYVKQHLKEYPDHVHAKELMANLYITEKKFDEAEELLLEALEQDPSRISAYRAAARIMGTEKRYKDIKSMYQKGLAAQPDNAEIAVMMAELNQFLGEYDSAVQIYEKVLEKYPNSLLIQNNLAALLLDHYYTASNAERAVLLTKSLEQTSNPAFLDTAGWAQYKVENYPQALSLLQAAYSGGGKAPVYLYHLGMAYHKNGMDSQAIKYLEQAVEDQDIKYSGKEEAVKTLEKLKNK